MSLENPRWCVSTPRQSPRHRQHPHNTGIQIHTTMHTHSLRNLFTLAAIALAGFGCSSGTSTHTIGGTVTGLDSGELVLQLNGTATVTISQNGPFEFPVRIASDVAYDVVVASQPVRTLAALTNATGIATHAIADIQVQLEPGYQVSGVASGLDGPAVIQLNGADDLTLDADGSFAFPTLLANGAAYEVTIVQSAPSQTMQVYGAAGTVSGSDADDVVVRGRQWTLPATAGEHINPTGTDTSDPAVATSANGDTVVVWNDYDGSYNRIYLSERRDGVWTHPADLSDAFSLAGSDAYNPAVAISDTGDTVVTWQQYDGTEYQIYFSEYRAGTWTHPNDLSEHISVGGSYSNAPDVVVNGSGEALVYWRQYDGSIPRLYKSEYRAGSWTNPADIQDYVSLPTGQVYNSTAAIDADGNIMLFWSQYNGTQAPLYLSEYRNGAWTHPADAADTFSFVADAWELQAASNRNGTFTITWEGYDETQQHVYTAVYENGTWTQPADETQHISPAGTSCYDHVVCLADNGDVVISWIGYDGTEDRTYLCERRSGNWLVPADATDFISPNVVGHYPEYPQLACDTNGNTVLMWTGYDGSADFHYRSIYRNGTWTHPTDGADHLELTGTTYPWDLTIECDGVGNFAVAWMAYDGANDNLYFAEYR